VKKLKNSRNDCNTNETVNAEEKETVVLDATLVGTLKNSVNENKPWYLLKDDFEIYEHIIANGNNDIWFHMTKMKLAKLGIDVGVDMSGEIKLAEEHGHEKRLEFETNDKYKTYILDYVTEALARDELTDECKKACADAWGNIPEEDMEDAVYQHSLKTWAADVDEAYAWGEAVIENMGKVNAEAQNDEYGVKEIDCEDYINFEEREAQNEEVPPWDDCDDFYKYKGEL